MRLKPFESRKDDCNELVIIFKKAFLDHKEKGKEVKASRKEDDKSDATT